MIKQVTAKKIVNVITAVSIAVMVIFFIYGVKTGLFSNKVAMQQLVTQGGVMGPLLFIGIQIVQVVIPIIPGGVSCAAGVILFGAWQGFLYNYIGIVIGSLINFYLARKYGQCFVKYFVKEATYEKYAGWLEQGKRFDKLFAAAIFFPCAPDDFLCMLAGLTKMSWKKFSVIIIFGKPVSIAVYSMALIYAGSWVGQLIA